MCQSVGIIPAKQDFLGCFCVHCFTMATACHSYIAGGQCSINAIVNLPDLIHLSLAPIFWMIPLEFCQDLCYEKIRVPRQKVMAAHAEWMA